MCVWRYFSGIQSLGSIFSSRAMRSSNCFSKFFICSSLISLTPTLYKKEGIYEDLFYIITLLLDLQGFENLAGCLYIKIDNHFFTGWYGLTTQYVILFYFFILKCIIFFHLDRTFLDLTFASAANATFASKW